MAEDRRDYDRLLALYRETTLLESVSQLLEWDQETNLPPSGGATRADQLELLAGLAHQRLTAPELGELLARLEGSPLATADPLGPEAVNIREIGRRYRRRTRLPDRLVRELARTASLAHRAWIEARRESDFALFRPWLERTVALKREQAAALGFQDSPYDALLDEYEPEMTARELEPLFGELQAGLARLLERIEASAIKPGRSPLERHYPPEGQRWFGRFAATAIGFDFRAGRLDEVVHPFCTTVGQGDVRITTRYAPEDFAQAFFGIIHEAGHGLYEQGLPAEHWGTPRGRRSRWGCTSPSPGCGRTSSAAAGSSGATSCPWPGECSPRRWGRPHWRSSCGRSTWCGPRWCGWRPMR